MQGVDMNTNTPMGIQGVVFDWAGTIVDFGSLAPMGAFVELFKAHGVALSVAQARVPMGLPKLDHIRELGRMPEVAQAWQAHHGRAFSDADAHSLLLSFEPMSAAAALANSDFIPGFMDSLAWLQGKGTRVATTTGYTRTIMRPLISKAQALGFAPDLVVCCDDVERSRPDPMGMHACMAAMDLSGQAQSVLKVDDTAPGLAEGLNAGCWTVGVAASGNALGWSLAQWNAASFEERLLGASQARARLLEAGAHEVINTVAELPEVIARLQARMEAGQTP